MMALINIALYWSKAKLEFLVLGWSVVVQTDFHVKPTSKLLGLGWCCLAWLQGYDNNDIQLQIVTDSYRQLQIVIDSYRQLQIVTDSYRKLEIVIVTITPLRKTQMLGHTIAWLKILSKMILWNMVLITVMAIEARIKDKDIIATIIQRNQLTSFQKVSENYNSQLLQCRS